jgi:hypothetical protein
MRPTGVVLSGGGARLASAVDGCGRVSTLRPDCSAACTGPLGAGRDEHEPMTHSWRISLAVVVALVTAATTVGCAGPLRAADGPVDASAAMAAFAAAPSGEQLVSIDESARALDAVVAGELGLDTALDTDPAEAAALLLEGATRRRPHPSSGSPGRRSPVRTRRAQRRMPRVRRNRPSTTSERCSGCSPMLSSAPTAARRVTERRRRASLRRRPSSSARGPRPVS